MIANTLGNNLAVSCPKLRKQLEKRYKYRIKKKTWIVLWRLIASIPPLILTLFLKNLAFTLMIAGFSGIQVAFVFPALLQIYSILNCERQFGTSETMFSWHFSKPIYILLVLLFSIFAAVVILCQMFDALLNNYS